MNALEVRRDANGHFLRGTSGNISGRPKGAGAIRDLAREYLPAALGKIGALIGSADERVALAASQEILNRVFGKPIQAVESEVRKFDMASLYKLASEAVNRDPAAFVDITPSSTLEPATEAETEHSEIEW